MTSKFDLDNRRSGRAFPVSRKLVAISVDPTSSSTSWTKDVQIYGMIEAISYQVAGLAGSTTIRIDDEDSITWYTESEITKDAGYSVTKMTNTTRFAYCGTATFAATTTVNQASSTTINVTVYLR